MELVINHVAEYLPAQVEEFLDSDHYYSYFLLSSVGYLATELLDSKPLEKVKLTHVQQRKSKEAQNPPFLVYGIS